MQAQRILTEHALDKVFAGMRGGSFAVIFPNSEPKHYGDDKPLFTVRINDANMLDLLQGDLMTNFAQAYVEGRIDIEGDIADLVALALQSGSMSAIQKDRLAAIGLRLAGRSRRVDAAKANIAHHYDLGNDFFSLWLDRSMTYSCGYFRDDADTLEQAQQQKIDHSLRKLRLKADERLLDIGCGWGALVMRAADHYGADVTGITLSKEQRARAYSAIESRGLENKANCLLMDYAELAHRGERFDKIVSIGMIEHVGKEHLAAFMQNVETLLRPGGLALLHMITTVKEGPVNGWIEKNIFPGGYIPTIAEIIGHVSTRDLRVWDVENLAPHYRRTLDHWSRRFERAVPQVAEKFDEQFVRMWRFYLRASSAAFRQGSVELHQVLVSRGQPSELPLTRDDLYRPIHTDNIVWEPAIERQAYTDWGPRNSVL